MAAGNQGTLLSTVTFPEFTDLVRHEWLAVREDIQRNARQLFIEDTGMEGSSKRYDEYDTETYADNKGEGVNSKKAKSGVGYNVTLTAKTVSKEVEVTYEMRRQNRYLQVLNDITNLAKYADNRMDLDLTHRLTFAGDTSYTDKNGDSVTTTVGDALAVASAVHTLAFSSTTFNNIVTGNPAFSETSLESALLIGATQIFSNFAEKRSMNFNTIVTGNDPNTIRTVRQVLESTADVDAAQAGVKNVYMGQFRHVVLPNLATTAAGAYNSAKRRYWFLVASGQALNGWQAYLGIWDEPFLKTPSIGNNGEDVHNWNWTYSSGAMYGIATVSPKGIICSLVAS